MDVRILPLGSTLGSHGGHRLEAVGIGIPILKARAYGISQRGH